MANKIRWVGTTGGPHILGPVEGLAQWRGIEGWRENRRDDESDYARACRIKGWLGKVSKGAGPELVVFSGDVGPIAWFPHVNGESGTLVQVLTCDGGEEAIFALLEDREALNRNASASEEQLEFHTGKSGVLTVFDSTIPGDDAISKGLIMRLRPSHYEIVASSAETQHCAVVLREVRARTK